MFYPSGALAHPVWELSSPEVGLEVTWSGAGGHPKQDWRSSEVRPVLTQSEAGGHPKWGLTYLMWDSTQEL